MEVSPWLVTLACLQTSFVLIVKVRSQTRRGLLSVYFFLPSLPNPFCSLVGNFIIQFEVVRRYGQCKAKQEEENWEKQLLGCPTCVPSILEFSLQHKWYQQKVGFSYTSFLSNVCQCIQGCLTLVCAFYISSCAQIALNCYQISLQFEVI